MTGDSRGLPARGGGSPRPPSRGGASGGGGGGGRGAGGDEEEDAVHSGVGVGEATAVGVEGEVAAGRGALAGDEGTALAPAAEAERLQSDQRRVGERVVDLYDVDILMRHAGHLEGEGAGDAGGRIGEVGHGGDRLVGGGLAGAEDEDGLLATGLRALGAGDDDGAPALRAPT